MPLILPMEEEDLDMAMDVDMENAEDASVEVSLEPEANQRSLHDFFPADRASSEPPKQGRLLGFFSAPAMEQTIPQENQLRLESMFATKSQQWLPQPVPSASEPDVEVPGGRHRHDWGWPRM